jgi:uncharacterized membrane protein
VRTRLLELWERISSGMWFVPTLLVLGHIAAAITLILVNPEVDAGEGERVLWIFRGGADSARSVLSTIASSMITVMGVVFSITIVALQLASSQYTPRVLYTFTRDRGNQAVMGSFIGTFTYTLLVLRAVRSPEDGTVFVPTVAVAGGIVLALVSVAALIYFIHHISSSIRVSNIIARIAATTRPLMQRPFPRLAGHPIHMDPRPEPPPDARDILSLESGYVMLIDGNALIDIACRRDAVVFLLAGPGDFVNEGMPLMRLHPPGPADEDRDGDLCGAFAFGIERSMQQDPEFGVRQLMDIAVKALSPSINDTTTAISCLDYLGSLMLEVADEEDPETCRADASGRLRLVGRGATFASLLGHGFDQIRQNMTESVAVTIRFIEVLARIGERVRAPERRAILWTQAREALRVVERAEPGERDRAAINDAVESLAASIHYDPTPLLLAIRP